MSQQERKILVAKRHGTKPFRRPTNDSSTSSSFPSQGVKRHNEYEQTEQPTRKRQNRNGNNTPQQQKSHNISQQKSNNISQQQKSHNSCPKNLAQHRLQNLRNSLEIKRRLSEGHSSPACTSKSFSDNIKVGTSPLITSTSKSICSTPISMRLKRKNTESPLASSSVSNNQEIEIKETLNPNVTAENNINIDVDLNEEMEWTEIDEKGVVNDIIDLRKEINYNKDITVAKEVENTISFSSDGVFIVVDTNIFLSQLTLLSQLKNKDFTDMGHATVLVPWMVIQELDYMKESHCSGSLTKAARKAVHYINTLLANKDPHFAGQSVMDAAKLEMSSKNPDDGILFCCLQLIEKGKYTILLSNDINLRNKALVNNVQAYSSNEIINSLNNPKTLQSKDPTSEHVVQKIKILLSNLLTHVIECEMKEAYGDVWKKMAMMQPPFTTEEALNCLIKYWMSVFSFSLQKQCKLKIEDFITFLKQHRNGSNYFSEDLNKFIELTLSLCIYLKNGYNQYRNLVCECITNIQKCVER